MIVPPSLQQDKRFRRLSPTRRGRPAEVSPVPKAAGAARRRRSFARSAKSEIVPNKRNRQFAGNHAPSDRSHPVAMPARRGRGIELLVDPNRRRIMSMLAVRGMRSSAIAAAIGRKPAGDDPPPPADARGRTHPLDLVATRRPRARVRGECPNARSHHGLAGRRGTPWVTPIAGRRIGSTLKIESAPEVDGFAYVEANSIWAAAQLRYVVVLGESATTRVHQVGLETKDGRPRARNGWRETMGRKPGSKAWEKSPERTRGRTRECAAEAPRARQPGERPRATLRR